MNLEKGAIYVASGEKYIKEAIFSAESFRKFNPEPITLIVDKAYPKEDLSVFDEVMVRECQHNYIDKLHIIDSPYKKTIFLDTDTYVCYSLNDLFELLDFTPFAIHQADEGYEYVIDEFNGAMPEFNTGVFAFKKNDAVKKLFDDWRKSYIRKPEISTDQYHLRWALYHSEIRYSTFSSAYNFIIYYPNYVIQKVRVLHGRPVEKLPLIARDINNIRHSNAWRRYFHPTGKNNYIIYQNPNLNDSVKLFSLAVVTFLKNIKRTILRK